MAKREEAPQPGGAGVPEGAPRRDINNPTHFGGDPRAQAPFIDPRVVSSPTATRYAQQAAERRRGTVPRYSTPVAGGGDIPIPRLDGEPQAGLTMSEQALAERGAMPTPDIRTIVGDMGTQPAFRGAPGGIVEGDEHRRAQPASARPGAVPPGIRPGDLLPPQAQQDPLFRQGQGSMFAANQPPELAYKYGVVRQGQHIPAQVVVQERQRAAGVGARPGLKPETVEGIEALQSFQKQRERAESGAGAIEEEALKGPAGAAGPTAPALSEEDKRDLLEGMDELDLNRLKNALFKDLLNNEDQKKIIEGRLKPLDIGELIVGRRVTQVVPVHPGVFEPEFQSYLGEEELIIKRLVYNEQRQNDVPDRYILDKHSIMGVTIALRSVNKVVFPDYLDAQGEFNEEKFWEKYKVVSRLNYHMIASLLVNWFWFDMRVRSLFKAETLGNG